MRFLVLSVVVCVSSALNCAAQDKVGSDSEFSRKNTFSVFAEYANDSSHIWLGYARDRKLADAGGAYARRIARFWGSDLAYQVELQPVLFESDPVQTLSETENGTPVTVITTTGVIGSNSAPTEGSCVPASGTVSFPSSSPGGHATIVNYDFTCSRRWTFGQAFSPVGMKYSMRTRHRVQPFVGFTGGYMYTTRPVPTAEAGSFNFTFNFDAGVEVFRTGKRSVSFTARFHHFSNKATAAENPGVDQILYKVSYNFGR